jgi:hypothetical protein
LKVLSKDGHALTALSRHAGTNLPPGVRLAVWDASKGEAPADGLRDADAIIHLAGAPVAQRWNAQVKQQIRESRVAGTRNLVQALAKLSRRPQVLICGSATGYYGSRGDEVLAESSAPGSDFLAEVCVAWEKEAQAAEALGMRVVRVRTGIALDARGGALPRMLPPFKMGVGGKLGSGKLDVLDSPGRPRGSVSVRAGQPGERSDERSGAEPGQECRVHPHARGGGASSGDFSGAGVSAAPALWGDGRHPVG